MEASLMYRALTDLKLRRALPQICVDRYCRPDADQRCPDCRRIIPKFDQPISGEKRKEIK